MTVVGLSAMLGGMKETLLYDSSLFPVSVRRVSVEKGERPAFPSSDELTLVLMEEGDVTLFFKETNVPLVMPAALFINRLADRRLLANTDATFTLIRLGKGFFTQDFTKEKFIIPLVHGSVEFLTLPSRARARLEEAIDALEEGRFAFELAFEAGILDIFAMLCYEQAERIGHGGPVQDERLTRMLDFMEANKERRLSLEEIAKAGFVSQREASRLFERLLSSSPMKYFLSMRLAEAARLLESSDEPVARIAEKTGFESLSHFSTCFRKSYSMSPTAYRSRRGRQGGCH